MPVIITDNNNEKQVWLKEWAIKFGFYLTYGQVEESYEEYFATREIVKSEILADNREHGGVMVEVVQLKSECALKIEEQKDRALKFFRKQIEKPASFDFAPIVAAIKFIFLLPLALIDAIYLGVTAIPGKKIAKKTISVAKRAASFPAKVLLVALKVVAAIVVSPFTAVVIYVGMIKEQFENGVVFGLFSSAMLIAATVLIAPVVAIVLFGSAMIFNLEKVL